MTWGTSNEALPQFHTEWNNTKGKIDKISSVGKMTLATFFSWVLNYLDQDAVKS